ncbi:hypothetical protein MPSEU_000301100 [Mayamaea pseudoterrestris]|nr:hypothetical protein MPSEU_000301100 [Mayamaea pseudoterrestris]
MPTWEGIEDGSANAASVWLARTLDSSEEWMPLRKSDSQALNQAAATKDTDTRIYIECGRATAFVEERIIRYNFVRGNDRSLCRSVWFRREENKGKDSKALLHPILNDEDGDKIESLFQQAVAATGSLSVGISSVMKEEVELSDGSVVKLNKSGNALKLVVTNKGWFATQYNLQRGYGEYNVEGEDNEALLGPVRHLVFVVHGIGENYFSREDSKFASILQAMNQLRTSVQTKQVEQWKEQCKLQKTVLPPPPRIEFLPIEWFDRLHDSSSALMKSLQLTTLPTIPALRAIANDVVFDVLMYLTPNFCQATLECVSSQICDLHAKFNQVHPEFKNNGKCSLIGHSLGSVICWDLLAILKNQQDQDQGKEGATTTPLSPDPKNVGYQAYAYQGDENAATPEHGTWGPSLTRAMTVTLPFEPDCTLFLGSPIGLFLTLRGAHAVFDEMRCQAVEEAKKRLVAAKGSPDESMTVPSASPFTLPTRALYNIFHPSDPVAYRIEPLLLRPDMTVDELPPPIYLTAPGKEVRLHLKAKLFGDALSKNLSGPGGNLFGAFITTLSQTEITKTKTAAKKDANGTLEPLAEWPPTFPLSGKDSARVDYSLQTGVVDSEYISAVTAHSNYFTNLDFHDFLIARLGRGDPTLQASTLSPQQEDAL